MRWSIVRCGHVAAEAHRDDRPLRAHRDHDGADARAPLGLVAHLAPRAGTHAGGADAGPASASTTEPVVLAPDGWPAAATWAADLAP